MGCWGCWLRLSRWSCRLVDRLTLRQSWPLPMKVPSPSGELNIPSTLSAPVHSCVAPSLTSLNPDLNHHHTASTAAAPHASFTPIRSHAATSEDPVLQPWLLSVCLCNRECFGQPNLEACRTLYNPHSHSLTLIIAPTEIPTHSFFWPNRTRLF